MSDHRYLGIDVGTSGVRTSLIDEDDAEIAITRVEMPAPVRDGNSSVQDSQIWINALSDCLQQLKDETDTSSIDAIAVDATSSSVLLCLDNGQPLTAAMMYNDSSSSRQADVIADCAPADSGAHGASSSLAKLMSMRERFPQLAAERLCHQADYINGWLCDRYDISDENNCLKLGYDLERRCWPDWLQDLDVPMNILPQVVRPGTVIGTVSPGIADRFGLDRGCKLVSGTTDSIAAFIATGADQNGDAVTSLGSSLVVKHLSSKPVFDRQYGIYSHRYYASDELWLVGGASNTGCKALSEIFSQQQLDELSTRLDPGTETGLHYVVLPAGSEGERFPVADPTMRPCIEPRPDDDAMYFQGLLESIADVEQRAYELLEELGCEPATRVISCGGGSRNQAWNRIRERKLGRPVSTALHAEASYGAALLAKFAMNR